MPDNSGYGGRLIPASRFPARIHVLLARDAPVGVVIRRGPSKTVCTIKWDRRRDKFAVGQWMRGRIYERRTDLSSDGKYLIYFAMNGRWQGPAKGSWTAISRAPYLKAITLLPKGDCWNGGGLFVTPDRYWLNDGYGHQMAQDSREVLRDPLYRPQGGSGNECLGVYYPRLMRDGWRFVESHDRTPSGARWPVNVDVFEKAFADGWSVRKLAYASVEHDVGTGCYWDVHELVHPRREIVIPQPKWEWAEVDGSRLVWAEDGALQSGRVNKSGLCKAKLLADFNAMKFEAIAAPY
jgi:hypothetical protein